MNSLRKSSRLAVAIAAAITLLLSLMVTAAQVVATGGSADAAPAADQVERKANLFAASPDNIDPDKQGGFVTICLGSSDSGTLVKDAYGNPIEFDVGEGRTKRDHHLIGVEGYKTGQGGNTGPGVEKKIPVTLPYVSAYKRWYVDRNGKDIHVGVNGGEKNVKDEHQLAQKGDGSQGTGHRPSNANLSEKQKILFPSIFRPDQYYANQDDNPSTSGGKGWGDIVPPLPDDNVKRNVRTQGMNWDARAKNDDVRGATTGPLGDLPASPRVFNLPLEEPYTNLKGKDWWDNGCASAPPPEVCEDYDFLDEDAPLYCTGLIPDACAEDALGGKLELYCEWISPETCEEAAAESDGPLPLYCQWIDWVPDPCSSEEPQDKLPLYCNWIPPETCEEAAAESGGTLPLYCQWIDWVPDVCDEDKKPELYCEWIPPQTCEEFDPNNLPVFCEWIPPAACDLPSPNGPPLYCEWIPPNACAEADQVNPPLYCQWIPPEACVEDAIDGELPLYCQWIPPQVDIDECDPKTDPAGCSPIVTPDCDPETDPYGCEAPPPPVPCVINFRDTKKFPPGKKFEGLAFFECGGDLEIKGKCIVKKKKDKVRCKTVVKDGDVNAKVVCASSKVIVKVKMTATAPGYRPVTASRKWKANTNKLKICKKSANG